MIPYGRQDITAGDIEAVVDVLKSDWLTQGPTVPRFEKAVADYCGSRHAVAVSSATAALHIACRALGLGAGDILWTSPITFVASANCALYCGAEVDFVDIDSTTYNMSLEALSTKLEEAERQGRVPKIVVPVHFAGQPCEMEEIRRLSERYGFRVLEDASHAIGGRYRNQRIGGCRYSDITVFSFHPVKIITTGEGGMALTNDPDLSRRMSLLRSHGITREQSDMSGPPEGAWYYEQVDLGLNYRMTDIQAALGLSQLKRLDFHVERRHALADRYDAALRDLPIRIPTRLPQDRSALHLYVIWLGPEVRRSRREVFDALREAGVGVNVHYIPVPRQPYYRALGFRPSDFPQAERYYEGAITLPLFPTMSLDQQDRVVSALRVALGE